MKMQLILTLVMTAVVLVPNLSGATSLSSKITKSDESSNSPPQAPPMTKRQVVKQYVGSCSKKPTKGVKKEVNCDKLRKDAVEIVKDSLHTLGSSTKRTYLPTILKFFKSDEVVLRIAAADAIGMIGPQDNDAELLAPLADDPVPDVRMAVGQAIGRGKSPALNLLGQRVHGPVSGHTRFIPRSRQAPCSGAASEHLFILRQRSYCRAVSYGQGLNATTAFYKSKAKKGR